MQDGVEPGIIGKLFHWDTWKLWGNEYELEPTTVLSAPSDDELTDEEELARERRRRVAREASSDTTSNTYGWPIYGITDTDAA